RDQLSLAQPAHGRRQVQRQLDLSELVVGNRREQSPEFVLVYVADIWIGSGRAGPLDGGDRVALGPAALDREAEEPLKEDQVVADRLGGSTLGLCAADVAVDVVDQIGIDEFARQDALGLSEDAFVVLNSRGLTFEEVAEMGDVGIAGLAQRE